MAKDGQYYLFFKTEGQGNGIKVAVSDRLTGGYVPRDRYVQQTPDPVEGAGTFKLNNFDEYILMYDLCTEGRYQFIRTHDLTHFAVVAQEVTMNFYPRHGTVLLTVAPGTSLRAFDPGFGPVAGACVAPAGPRISAGSRCATPWPWGGQRTSFAVHAGVGAPTGAGRP